METKSQFRFFSIFEYEKEQEYLRDMHRSGWRFVRVCGIGTYYFEKCAPEDVVYQLDYNQEGRRNKEEYVQMFQDCGWEYLQDHVGYSYFRKKVSEMTGPEEIFCDDESRLQMMNRVFKGRMIPLLLILFFCLIPQLFHTIFYLHDYFIAVLVSAVLALYVAVFTIFMVKYNAYRRNAEK